MDVLDFLQGGVYVTGQFLAIEKRQGDLPAHVAFRPRFLVAARVEGFGSAVVQL